MLSAQKILSLVFIFVFALLISPKLVFAADIATSSATPSAIINSEAAVNPFTPAATDNLFVSLLHTFSCITEGRAIDHTPCFGILDTVTSKLPVQGLNNGQTPTLGAIGITQTLIMSMFLNPPIHTAEYLADAGKLLNPVKTAHAQVSGSGNAVIQPVLGAWKLMRNLSYVFMTLIFVVIGLMVMFQRHINPQTVISVQNAIPGLIVGLVLITFSYFLAALIIDSSFLVTTIVGKTLETVEVSPGKTLLPANRTNTILESHNVLQIYNSFMTSLDFFQLHSIVSNTLTFITSGFVGTMIDGILGMVGFSWGFTKGYSMTPAHMGTAPGVFPGNTPAILVGIGAGTASAIALVALKWTIISAALYILLILMLMTAMFKLFFSLLSSYISIIILAITGPFYFLVGSIPGRGGLISEWIKSMFAHILAFPAVFLAFVFAAYLGSTPSSNISAAFAGITPAESFTTSSTLPLFGGFPQDVIRLLLAYGVLLGSSAIPDMIKRALGVKGVEAFSQAAMGTIGPSMPIMTKAPGIGRNLLWRGAVNRNGQSLGPKHVGPVQLGYNAIRSRFTGTRGPTKP